MRCAVGWRWSGAASRKRSRTCCVPQLRRRADRRRPLRGRGLRCLGAGDPRLAADAAAQAQRVPDAATDLVLRLLLARVDSLLASRTGQLGFAVGVISGPLEAVAGGAGFGRDGAAWMVYVAALLDVAAGRDAFATAAAAAAGRARGASDRFATAEALGGQAFADHALGRWTSAYANGTLALGLLDADTAPFSVAGLQHLLADVDAARGRSESCLRRCAQVRALGQQLDLLQLQVLAERREGALHLATNRLDDAVRHLERARSLLRRTPVHHPILSPAPAAARLLRTRVLVADDDEYASLFQEAIDVDDRTDMRFFQARTRLCFGERLRRGRRQVLAREQLSAALEVFEEVDARPWADRARGELAATGAQVRQASIGGVADLTPQELQIALAAAEGRRNKKIADALFLSVRTVEFHLTRTFTKVGVRSRGELTARLTSQRPQ
jgi:DNA-binding CsgD family transcriptional regulator